MITCKKFQENQDNMEKYEPSKKLSKLAKFCKKKYNKADLLQHNWNHIVRNIYRAEKIAETEKT